MGNSFEGATQQVSLSTLDFQIKKHGTPDFVKIDVEGFESAVLKGLTRPDEKTVFFVEVRDSSASEVYDYFSANNFSCMLLDDQTDQRIDSPDQIPGFCNLMFRRS